MSKQITESVDVFACKIESAGTINNVRISKTFKSMLPFILVYVAFFQIHLFLLSIVVDLVNETFAVECFVCSAGAATVIGSWPTE